MHSIVFCCTYVLANVLSSVTDTTSAGGDAHVSYNLAFQIVFYSRDGVVTSTDSIDANPVSALGDCSVPKQSIQAALREVLVPRPCVCGISHDITGALHASRLELCTYLHIYFEECSFCFFVVPPLGRFQHY